MQQQQFEDQDAFFQEDQQTQIHNVQEIYLRQPINKQIINEQTDLYVMGIDVSCDVRPCLNSQNQPSKQPFVIIFGVNQHGNSIKVTITDFAPYFYSQIPLGINPDIQQELDKLRDGINQQVKFMKKRRQITQQNQQNKNKKNKIDDQIPDSVVQIIKVPRVSLKYYSTDEQKQKSQYLKIVTKTPGVIAPVRKLFLQGQVIKGVQLPRQTFQSNIPYILRFMIDRDIVGMGWFQIKAGNFRIVRQDQKKSYCQLEIQCSTSAIKALKSSQNNQYSKIAPLRVLSFDIQCLSAHGFPSAQRHTDKIIQIACTCKTTTRPVQDFKIIYALNGCSPISGVHVRQQKSQENLLKDFQKLIRSYDPDFIIGYNIINFDLKYIIQRANFLGLRGFGVFGRNHNKISRLKDTTFQSKVMGMRDTKQINIEGRIQLDLLIHMHKEHKLSSYTLNNVSYHFLQQQKQDVHHTQIGKLFQQSRQSRKRIAVYCQKDADLPLSLMEKLCCLYNYSEMARVTGVPINYLFTKGQQIKVTSQLLRKAKQHKYIMPYQSNKGKNEENNFQGACVLDPISGFYQQPIATLDFASLYPSIMMAHNLCYTTLLPFGPHNKKGLQEYSLTQNDCKYTPMKNLFVKKQKREGLLPQILRQLIEARKKAKKQLAQTKDQLMKAVLDGRQLALKISANSVYGYTGAVVGHFPCLQISSSVTAYGRQMIQQTKNSVLRIYPKSKVIYGDTDSVMVKFPLKQNQSKTQQIIEAMEYGKQAAKLISEQFDKPIKLQFEKVYCPYLLITKKRYAGVYYTKPQKPDKIDKKGLQTVRRDNCFLVRETLQKVINMILWENDIKKAQQYIKGIVKQLVQNKIDISKLVITKAITKKSPGQEDSEDQNPNKVVRTGSKDVNNKPKANTYKSKQAHAQLAQKMKKRDENVEIHIGDRISYVMIMGAKGSKNYQNSQDPIKVLNEDLPIDFDYYINKQLKPPLERMLKNSGIVKNFDSLFNGQHTKNRYIPKVKDSSFLGKFVKIQSTCMNCPSKIPESQPLCSQCSTKAIDVYLGKQFELANIKRKYNQLWVQCQNCQGSVTMPVICSNMDCPIYYQRIKYKNTIKDKEKAMNRFKNWTYPEEQTEQQDNQVDF